MTVLQVTLQPFGILNALRNRFVIPFAISFLQRVALFNPKESFTYKTVGG
jgi:26S proteasome regulatory subunit N1